jgi:TrmH family RNA methyltransferase
MGSALRLNVWENADFAETIAWARAAGLRTTAADVSGALDFRSIDRSAKRLFVFGSEAHGLSADELREMDEVIVIPMKCGVESLNLAVSAGIILYEMTRDR